MKYLKMFLLLSVGLLFVISGCMPIPSEYISPEVGLRMLEGKYGTWYLLKHDKSKEVNMLAVRLDAPNPLYLFQNKYQFYRLSKNHIIANDSIPKKLHNLIIEKARNVHDFSTRRTFIEADSGKEIISFGCFLNIDKIFADNNWCDYVIVDDLDNGMLFTRNKKEFMGDTFNRMKLEHCQIIGESRNYQSIIKLKPDSTNPKP